MSKKSHVSLGQHQCLVCGKLYDSGEVLLDRRLQPSMERRTVTGQGLCPDDQKLHDNGYIALVAVDPTKSAIKGDKLHQNDAYRTGEVMHVRREVAARIFNTPMLDDLPMVYVEPEVLTILKQKYEEAKAAQPKSIR